jgi:arsenate reductase (glutaredoxin)
VNLIKMNPARREYCPTYFPPCATLFSVPLASVQIFGLKGSQETRAAERFFKERGVPIHFVDLKERPMAPGEIRRFIEKFGFDQLIDQQGKAYADAGLKYLKVSADELLAKTEKEPKLLRLPFVRGNNKLAIGKDEAGWKAMLG